MSRFTLLAILLTRGANALFCLLTLTYGLLVASPFAYEQFIKPQVTPVFGGFVIHHHSLFFLVWLITALSLIPDLRQGRARLAAWGYLVAGGAASAYLVAAPILPVLGNSPKALMVGLVAMLPAVWLGIIDHLAAPQAASRPSGDRRVFVACLLTAAYVWLSHAIAAPLRLQHVVGVQLSAGALVAGIGRSAVLHGVVAMGFFLALMSMIGAASLARRPQRTGYWLIFCLLVGGIATGVAAVCYTVGVTGEMMAAASVGCAFAVAMVWSGAARRIAGRSPGVELDPVDVWVSPLARGRRPVLAWLLLLALPVATYLVGTRAPHVDWSFLVQKSMMVIVWIVSFACIHTLVPARRQLSPVLAAAPPITVLAVYQALTLGVPALTERTGIGAMSVEAAVDRYAAIDPAFHLLNESLRTSSTEAAEFYTYLKANSTLARVPIDPIDIDFVESIRPAPGRKPHIFLLMVDSLRRDYVSAYNPDVTFTPALGELARDSFVFTRAFSRYGSTGLSVPALWAGGMLIHKQYVTPFRPMNALGKLLDAQDYVQYVTSDHITDALFGPSPSIVDLDADIGEMQHTMCATLSELMGRLERRDPSRPVFAMTRSLELHMAKLLATKSTFQPSTGAFFGPTVSYIEPIDQCIGRFVGDLKRTGLYEDSIIIVMSDHGDSLGEHGRWGHAYTLFPEVVRIPLIMRLPSWLRERVTTDLSRAAFSTDVTPTLYSLLGQEPADKGPLFGDPLFVERGQELADRRQEPFLLASSYGPVYGMLRHNGRLLYVANAREGREYAYDLRDPSTAVPLTITQAMRDLNWRLIREQVRDLGRQYRFGPAE